MTPNIVNTKYDTKYSVVWVYGQPLYYMLTCMLVSMANLMHVITIQRLYKVYYIKEKSHSFLSFLWYGIQYMGEHLGVLDIIIVSYFKHVMQLTLLTLDQSKVVVILVNIW